MQRILATLPGNLSVDRDPGIIARYLPDAADFAGSLPIAIARPRELAQLHELVLWANRNKCPLVPVSSSGGPRRRGASWPSRSAIVADLSAMNRIIHVDDIDCRAVIEPGVTFPEFDAVLKSHGLRSFKPLLPRRNKSVLASHLDREPITSPHDHWDSEDPVGGTQLVFGNGETFRTGTAAVTGTLDEQLQKGARQMMALGPASTDFLRVIQGSQGTLAIVAWAAVFCEPIPALEQAFFAGSDDIAGLIELAYRILWRRTGGQLFIVNNTQLAMIGGRHAEGCSVLSTRLPKWILYVNLTCPDYFPEERLSFLVADLQADAAAVGLSITDQIGGYAANDIGVQQAELPQVHYKDRLRGAHRDVFFLTQLDQAPKFIAELNSLLEEHQATASSVGVYLQPRIQGVSAHFEVVFPFDPKEAAVAQRVSALADLSARRFAEAGAFFSRPYGTWADIAFEKDKAIKPYLAAVKEMLDPNGILSPGRLCF